MSIVGEVGEKKDQALRWSTVRKQRFWFLLRAGSHRLQPVASFDAIDYTHVLSKVVSNWNLTPLLRKASRVNVGGGPLSGWPWRGLGHTFEENASRIYGGFRMDGWFLKTP